MKFTVPRTAWYWIRYPDGTTETKLMEINTDHEFPNEVGMTVTEIAQPQTPTNEEGN